jgi:hypothetical protein
MHAKLAEQCSSVNPTKTERTAARSNGRCRCANGNRRNGRARTVAALANSKEVLALLRHGPERLTVVRDALERWLEEHEHDSLAQAQRSMSLLRCRDPTAYERASYLRILQELARRPGALSAVEHTRARSLPRASHPAPSRSRYPARSSARRSADRTPGPSL